MAHGGSGMVLAAEGGVIASDAEVAARFAAPGAEEGEVDDLGAREAAAAHALLGTLRRTQLGHRTAPALLPEAHLALDAARQLRNCLSRAPAGTGPAAPSPSARCAAARRWTWPAALRWALPSAEVVRRGATAEGVSWLERRGCEVLRARSAPRLPVRQRPVLRAASCWARTT